MAPDVGLWRRLRQLDVELRAGDIRPGTRTTDVFDLTDAPFPDGHFDVVLISHVLEHIQDDRSAIRELYRITRPGGAVLAQHPVDPLLDRTDESDSGIPEDRVARFGQADHLRAYGMDLVGRLSEPGFAVDVVTATDQLTSAERSAFCIGTSSTGRFRNDDIMVCRRRSADV